MSWNILKNKKFYYSIGGVGAAALLVFGGYKFSEKKFTEANKVSESKLASEFKQQADTLYANGYNIGYNEGHKIGTKECEDAYEVPEIDSAAVAKEYYRSLKSQIKSIKSPANKTGADKGKFVPISNNPFIYTMTDTCSCR